MQILGTSNNYIRKLKQSIRRRQTRLDPSFFAKVQVERRIADISAGILDVHRRELWSFSTKNGMHELAERMDIPVPSLIVEAAEAHEIEWDSLPEAFVVKPVSSAGGRGVRVLKRDESGFVEAVSGQHWSVSDLVRDYSCGRYESKLVIVEEAIGDGVRLPFDWKAYAFRGQVELVLQIDRNPSPREYCFYSSSFSQIRGLLRGRQESTELPLPENGENMIALASSLSSRLPLPFVRIDMYEDRDNVYVGEITPREGGGVRSISNYWDKRLGAAWEFAEAELRVELSRYAC